MSPATARPSRRSPNGRAMKAACLVLVIYGAWIGIYAGIGNDIYALWLAFAGTLSSQPPEHRDGSWRGALALLVLSVTPYLAYSIYLNSWLGSAISTVDFSPIPLLGIFHPPFRLGHQGIDLAVIVLPAVVWLVAFFPRRPLPDESWLPWLLMVVNLLVGVIFYRLF
jgi:hypothetical protein